MTAGCQSKWFLNPRTPESAFEKRLCTVTNYTILMCFDTPANILLKNILFHNGRQMLSVQSDNKYFRHWSQRLTSALVYRVKAATDNT